MRGNNSLTNEQDERSYLTSLIQAYVTRAKGYEELEVLEERNIKDSQSLLKLLNVDAANGLSTTPKPGCLSIEERGSQFGQNILPAKELTSYWRLLWESSADPMLRILIGSAFISLGLGLGFGENPKIEWIEGTAIFLAVCIVIVVTATNDWLKEKQFESLYNHEEKFTNCIRDGAIHRINIQQLVVGDILSIEQGDEIPADSICISSSGLKADESSLTGESDHINKLPIEVCRLQIPAIALIGEKGGQSGNLTAESQALPAVGQKVASPVLLSGTVVVNGSGQCVVVGVGVYSQVGRLYTKLAVDTEPTPLQNKLNALARDVGKFGLISALIIFIILQLEYWILYGINRQGAGGHDGSERIVKSMINFLIQSITIVVVAVPEGLPLAVTISLAFSVGRMLQDQNYVRRLAACETMGGANEICSDKTGTLTKNQMEVNAFWNGSQYTLDTQNAVNGPVNGKSQNNESSSPAEIADGIPLPPDPYKWILIHSICINSTGYLDVTDQNRLKQVGSPTECALLLFAAQIGGDYRELRAMYSGALPHHTNIRDAPIDLLIPLPPTPQPPGGPDACVPEGRRGLGQDMIVFRVPFSSDRKFMATVVKVPGLEGKLRVFMKGAAEVVLRRCEKRVDSSGSLKQLDDAKISKIEQAIVNRFASLALRTICLAYKDFDPADPTGRGSVDNADWKADPELICRDLICLGLAGIRDPVRDEVPAAVKTCQKAGIKVRMCTGDNIETAKQIALKANIYHPEQGGIAMLGPEFSKLVGGVVCQNCRTEVCPCQSNQQDSTRGALPEEADTGEADPGCCKKRKPGEVQPISSGKGKRIDVLGNQTAFDAIADRLEILARSQPIDKYVLVTGLKARGAVVAVTGDGTNDAPALKKADVGFAMGITGKEVAKQAADIVLLDDNFESIVRACKWGRNIYDNIQRFLQFQLTVNAVAVFTAFIGAMLIRGSPLSAVQLLWVNLIMDTFAALALATEKPSDKLLDRPPHSRTEYLVSKMMFRNIIAQVVYQFSVMMAVIFTGNCWLPEYYFDIGNENREKYPDYTIFDNTGCSKGRQTVRSGRAFQVFSGVEDYKDEWVDHIGHSRHYTYVFSIFVLMQAFNLVNARKIGAREFNIFQGLLSNYYWICIMTLIVCGQILIVELGGYGVGVHPDGLTWQQWLICAGFGAGTWVVGTLVKLLPSSVVQVLPETGRREINPLDEPTSLALASRGRISSGRISTRMNLQQYPPAEAARVRSSILAMIPRTASGMENTARSRPSQSVTARQTSL